MATNRDSQLIRKRFVTSEQNVRDLIAYAQYLKDHSTVPSKDTVEIYKGNADNLIKSYTARVLINSHPKYWVGVSQSILGTFFWAVLLLLISLMIIVNSKETIRNYIHELSEQPKQEILRQD